MIRLPNLSVVVLKLKLTDTLDVTSERNPTIRVNKEVIYHVFPYSEGYAPFKVKRSVFGTSLHIPSMHYQRNIFENGGYNNQHRGMA